MKMVWAGLVSVVMASSGCSKAARTEDLSLLHLRVVPGGSNPAIPDASASGLQGTALVDGNEVEFPETLVLVDPSKTVRPLFVAFDDGGVGSPVQEAYYQHRTEDAAHHETQDPDKLAASYDAQSKCWFIPFGRLFNGHEADADPNDLHFLNLDILLANGDRLHPELRFRVSGAIPDVGVTPMTLDAPGAAPDFAHSAAQGVAIGKYRLSNPGRHSVKVWLRATSPDPTAPTVATMTLHTELGVPRYPNTGAGPGAPTLDRYSSVASFVPGKVTVLRDDGQAEELAAPQGGWVAVVAQAGEQFTLEWWGVPIQGTVSCSLPSPESKEFDWYVQNQDCNALGNCTILTGETHHSSTMTEAWAVMGARLTGSWNLALWVSDPFLTSDALKSAMAGAATGVRAVQGKSLVVDVDRTAGQVTGGVPSFGCLGTF